MFSFRCFLLHFIKTEIVVIHVLISRWIDLFSFNFGCFGTTFLIKLSLGQKEETCILRPKANEIENLNLIARSFGENRV